MKSIITETDYNALKSGMLNLPPAHKTKEMLQQVESLLTRLTVVKDSKITPDVIGINSCFEAKEENAKQNLKFTLTLPSEANLQERKISVLSPLGMAVMGFKENMTINFSGPAGNKRLKILKVVNPSK
ncbi:MAG: GreA/GreB family elongation factor [Bacteroidetes bacterium]|nr:GreA/GreB family elongation factor [Bacteroidota bacterium]